MDEIQETPPLDPMELVKEDDDKILAHIQEKIPVDLGKVESEFREFHRFFRLKTFEFQDKFEKTLVYLSSGAIVLTYGFLGQPESAHSMIALIVAIGSWGISCILSLITTIVHVRQSVGVLNSTGEAIVSAEAYQFWTKNLAELYKVSKLADHKFVFFKDKDGNDVKDGADKFKNCIDKIANELASEKDRLQESINASYTGYTSEWWLNAILLLFFVAGCVAFAIFTYLQFLK